MILARMVAGLAVVLVALAAGACAPAAQSVPTATSLPVKHDGPLPLAAEGTALRRIQDAGKVVIGVKYDIPTFGYMNPRTRKLEGFDVDVAKAVGRHIFGVDGKVEFVEARESDRIPFLEQARVNLVISTFTINEERAKVVDFSDVYFVAGQSLLVKSGSPIKDTADLAGRNVGTARGTTSEANIRKAAPSARVMLFDTFSEAVVALDAGAVEAVTTDDIILMGYVKQAPLKYAVVGKQFTQEPYGVGVAKNSPELLKAVNDAIYLLKRSDEWQAMFERNLGPGWQAVFRR